MSKRKSTCDIIYNANKVDVANNVKDENCIAGQSKHHKPMPLVLNPFKDILTNTFNLVSSEILKSIVLNLCRLDNHLFVGIPPNKRLPTFLNRYAGTTYKSTLRLPRKATLVKALVAYETNTGEPMCANAVWSIYFDHLSTLNLRTRNELLNRFRFDNLDIESYLRYRHLRGLSLHHLGPGPHWFSHAKLNSGRRSEHDVVIPVMSLNKSYIDGYRLRLCGSSSAATSSPLSTYDALVRSLSRKIVVAVDLDYKKMLRIKPLPNMLCNIVLAVDNQKNKQEQATMSAISPSGLTNICFVPSHDYIMHNPFSELYPNDKSFWFPKDQVYVIRTVENDRFRHKFTLDGYSGHQSSSENPVDDTPYYIRFRSEITSTWVAVHCFKFLATLPIASILHLTLLSIVVEYNY